MNTQKIYSEVLGVLMALDYKYTSKVPESVMKYLTQNCNINSIPVIDRNKRIEEQNVSTEARAFLTMLKLKYWCKTEEEKRSLLSMLNENEKRIQKELEEKYSADHIFTNKVKQDTNVTSIVDYREQSFFQKMLAKLLGIFKKDK